MVSLETFSELLEVLYSAPLQQEQWQHFLTLLSGYTESTTCFFICADTRLGLSVHANGGTPQPQTIQAYNEQYGRSDPFRAPALRQGGIGVFQDEQLLPSQGLTQTDLYKNVLGPAGLRHATILMLAASVRRLEAISLWRSPDQGPMPPDGIRLLELLVPHIQIALEVRQALGIAHHRLAGAETMADASSTATLMLAKDGRLIHRNAAAEALLQQGGCLSVKQDRLVATDAVYRNALRNLISNAASSVLQNAAPQPTHALSLPRPKGQRPLQLLATPLPNPQRHESSADLLLLVTDPDRTSYFPDNILRSLCGLTPAETEIANGLLMAYSLEEIATLRRVSVGTVRHQLKSILRKTGTGRQGDLIKLLMTLPQSFAN